VPIFLAIFGVVAVAAVGTAAYLSDAQRRDAPTPDVPPGTANTAETDRTEQRCQRRIAKGLEKAAAKGPRKAVKWFVRVIAFDSVGLPGSESLDQSSEAFLQGLKGGGLWGGIIAGIAGGAHATGDQLACLERFKQQLETIYGPRDSWERSRRGGGGAKGAGGAAARREASGPEFAGWDDMNRAQRSQAVQDYSRRRLDEIEAETGRRIEPRSYSVDALHRV
jgi:hypothetical protein